MQTTIDYVGEHVSKLTNVSPPGTAVVLRTMQLRKLEGVFSKYMTPPHATIYIYPLLVFLGEETGCQGFQAISGVQNTVI